MVGPGDRGLGGGGNWREAQYNRELFQLHHGLLRYLVERHGFSAYAMESGFVEGWLVDAWVRGGQDQLGQVMANGMTR